MSDARREDRLCPHMAASLQAPLRHARRASATSQRQSRRCQYSSPLRPRGSPLLPTPGACRPSPGTAATRILASDITDLRYWLERYEGNHPPHAQGIDTLSFDPTNDNRPKIQDDWAQDVLNLATQQPLFVRCNVKAPKDLSDPNHPADTLDLSQDDKDAYVSAFNTFGSRRVRVYALCGLEFYRRDHDGIQPDDDLSEDHTNTYITNFVDRLAAVVGDLYTRAGLRDCIIWNEPHPPGKDISLDPGNFAALLWACWNGLKDIEPLDPTPEQRLRMYWGGVHFGPGWVDPQTQEYHVDQGSLDYIEGVYNTLSEVWQVAGGVYGAWPWDGINIHVHGDFDGHPERLDSVLAAVNDIRNRKGDTGELLVGEWGFQNSWDTGLPDALSEAYRRFIDDQSRVDVMFFHAHHEINDPLIAPPTPIETDQLVPQGWPLPVWGIRYYAIAPGAYVLAQKTPLFSPYNELMGA